MVACPRQPVIKSLKSDVFKGFLLPEFCSEISLAGGKSRREIGGIGRDVMTQL
jgi:hypothetical protein